jgi:hypothetical protein
MKVAAVHESGIGPIAAPDVCYGTSGVGESRHRIPGASVGQPTEPCLGDIFPPGVFSEFFMISRHCSDEQLRTNEIEDLSGEEREIAALLKTDGVDWSCLCGAYSRRKDAEAVVAEFVRRPMNTVLTWQASVSSVRPTRQGSPLPSRIDRERRSTSSAQVHRSTAIGVWPTRM